MSKAFMPSAMLSDRRGLLMLLSEGINCIEKIKGMHTPDIDYNTIPGCTYCQPQVASVQD
ncbi:MAG: hypothetical protein R3A12_19250 [Ignavibacteria bacterium]